MCTLAIFFKVFGGYDFNQNFGVEVSYVDFGEASISEAGDSLSVGVSALTASAVGRLPVSDMFTVFGKLGFASYDVDVDFNIAGFGSVGEIQGPGTSQYFAGIKRRGTVVTAACTSVPESSHICWDFASPLGPPGTDSNSCKGDSGGPLFAAVTGLGTAVVGVTSGGNDSCLPLDNAFDADVHFDRAWIESVAGKHVVQPQALVMTAS